MAAHIILEFSGVTPDQYWAVNEKLGVDQARPESWPDGIIGHTAGTTEDGGFIVDEIWESQEKQAAFMNGPLGAALGEIGLPAPVRVIWTDVIADVRL